MVYQNTNDPNGNQDTIRIKEKIDRWTIRIHGPRFSTIIHRQENDENYVNKKINIAK